MPTIDIQSKQVPWISDGLLRGDRLSTILSEEIQTCQSESHGGPAWCFQVLGDLDDVWWIWGWNKISEGHRDFISCVGTKPSHFGTKCGPLFSDTRLLSKDQHPEHSCYNVNILKPPASPASCWFLFGIPISTPNWMLPTSLHMRIEVAPDHVLRLCDTGMWKCSSRKLSQTILCITTDNASGYICWKRVLSSFSHLSDGLFKGGLQNEPLYGDARITPMI